MNEKFFDLKKDKQDRMINAALKVFAMQGYRHASTDDMVREAGISKGLLFHYFGSKLGVYTFVFEYSVRYMTLELTSTIKKNETDFFELLKQKEQAKMQALRNYPYMQQFLDRCMVEDVSEALIAIEEKRNIFAQNMDGIYNQIDLSTLPSGVDGEKLWRMLNLTIKGLMTQRILDGSFQAGMLYEEVCEYIEMTKGLVTK